MMRPTEPLPEAAPLRLALAEAVERHGYLNGGVARIGKEGALRVATAGRVAPGGPVLERTDLRLRVASVSKAVTGRVAAELAVAGRLDLEAPVADLLGWTRAPARMEGVTLAMLLAHVSGLRDAAGYLIDRPASPMAFIEAAGERCFGREPAGWFTYCNLNYVLAAAAMEAATGERFDRLAGALVLEPAGIGGGFNWAGVADRDRRLAVWQRRAGGLVQQTEPEGADWGADIVFTDGTGHRFGAYVPVRDAPLMSPQGGLRLSLVEMAGLARVLGENTAAARLQRRALWRFDPRAPNGAGCEGLYQGYGLGLMLYEGHDRIPGRLAGHAGHALGFTGGAWHDLDTGASTAFFLNGAPDLTEGQEDEAFYDAAELALLRLA